MLPAGIPLQRVRFYKANSQPEGIGDNEDSGAEIVRWRQVPELMRLLLTNEFDVIFIDGKHTGDGLLNDMTAFWPFLKAGGLIICDDLHDAKTYKGVFDWAGQALASYEKFLELRHDEIEESYIWNYPRVPPGDFRGLRPFGLVRKKEKRALTLPPRNSRYSTPPMPSRSTEPARNTWPPWGLNW